MRKITEEAVQAFFNGQNFKKANTRVVADKGCAYLYSHDHMIAKRLNTGVFLNHCGWETNTTKERLNGVLEYLNASTIYQKDFVWYWRDEEFKTGWSKI